MLVVSICQVVHDLSPDPLSFCEFGSMLFYIFIICIQFCDQIHEIRTIKVRADAGQNLVEFLSYFFNGLLIGSRLLYVNQQRFVTDPSDTGSIETVDDLLVFGFYKF